MKNKWEKTGKRIKDARKEFMKEKAEYNTQELFINMVGLKNEEGKRKGNNINRETYSNWESGYRLPPTEMMLRLCEVFDCDITYLLGEHDEKHRKTHDLREEFQGALSEEAIDNIIKSTAAKKSAPEEFSLVDLINELAKDENESFIQYIGDTIKLHRDAEELRKDEFYKLWKGYFKLSKEYEEENREFDKDHVAQYSESFQPVHEKQRIQSRRNEFLKIAEPQLKSFYGLTGFYAVADKFFYALLSEEKNEVQERLSTIAFRFRDVVKELD